MVNVFHRASVGSLALAIGCTAFAMPVLAGDSPAHGGHRACLVVDTDVGLDDFRAVAALVPARDVRAVVVTEGIASVPGGASAISMFFASSDQTPPVIPGLASPTPPTYDWLEAARTGAERINYFLNDSIPFAGDPAAMTDELLAALRGCPKVDVLVLGPWTSYLEYGPVLGRRVRDVVASGLPIAENNPDNFNCEYDLAACEGAGAALERARSAAWVDLPAMTGEDLTYDPTEEMVARFAEVGMPGLLRAAFELTPSEWVGFTRLWDDAAALYLIAPEQFAQNGQHVEPVVDEATFRDLLVNATNAA